MLNAAIAEQLVDMFCQSWLNVEFSAATKALFDDSWSCGPRLIAPLPRLDPFKLSKVKTEVLLAYSRSKVCYAIGHRSPVVIGRQSLHSHVSAAVGRPRSSHKEVSRSCMLHTRVLT